MTILHFFNSVLSVKMEQCSTLVWAERKVHLKNIGRNFSAMCAKFWMPLTAKSANGTRGVVNTLGEIYILSDLWINYLHAHLQLKCTYTFLLQQCCNRCRFNTPRYFSITFHRNARVKSRDPKVRPKSRSPGKGHALNVVSEQTITCSVHQKQEQEPIWYMLGTVFPNLSR